jgi:hypothetical protein
MVLPHTPLIETTVAQLQQWFTSGRPHPRHRSEEAERLAEDYVASKATLTDYNPTAVDAQFQITLFLDHGKPASAADLNAAFELVLSRYDLKIGLWDLARDSGLRESLLTPRQVQAAPSNAAQMPEAARASAARSKRVRADRQEAESSDTLVWKRFDPRRLAIAFVNVDIELEPCMMEITEIKSRIEHAFKKLDGPPIKLWEG